LCPRVQRRGCITDCLTPENVGVFGCRAGGDRCTPFLGGDRRCPPGPGRRWPLRSISGGKGPLRTLVADRSLSLKRRRWPSKSNEPSAFSSRSQLRTGPVSIWRNPELGHQRHRHVASPVPRASLRRALSQDVCQVRGGRWSARCPSRTTWAGIFRHGRGHL
jgi:hypothetical protein